MPKNKPQHPDPLYVSVRPSGYRMFSDSQLAEIHHASLEILRRTGVRVYESQSLALLQEVGAIVSDENLVKFPPGVVEQALGYAPSRIVLCNRNGRAQLYLEGHRTYFGTGSDLPNFLDLQTGELSRTTGKGTHTTTTTIMYRVAGGGRLIDSPGVWEYGLWAMHADELAAGFPEFSAHLGTCRFNDCRHASEPACAIAQAVDEGLILPWRYAAYRRLLVQNKV